LFVTIVALNKAVLFTTLQHRYVLPLVTFPIGLIAEFRLLHETLSIRVFYLSKDTYVVFYFSVRVSVAVCEIFSVKEWRDLENQVKGRSRSLKMAPFDRPCTTFYGRQL